MGQNWYLFLLAAVVIFGKILTEFIEWLVYQAGDTFESDKNPGPGFDLIPFDGSSHAAATFLKGSDHLQYSKVFFKAEEIFSFTGLRHRLGS
jgi:hypothetical protein